ncbi:MAG TPA: ABC transporter permease [Pyrinomonadaceae bacterium]|nr:ABC transporter permease [Pyrinomonadaceae bacterium]
MPDWNKEIRSRLAHLRLEPAREAEIVEELSQHLEDLYEEKLIEGSSEEEALQAALGELSGERQLANELRVTESQVIREPVVLGAGRVNMIADLWQDLLYGFRVLLRQPVTSIIAVLTLALGIGANTAIFSVINGLLLRPLPYPKSEQVMKISQVDSKGQKMNFSDANFDDISAGATSFEAMAQYSPRTFSLSGGSEPVRAPGATVTSGFFKTLGVAPIMGRAIQPEEDRAGSAPVIVVSYNFWQRYLGGASDLSAKTLTFYDQPHQVIGVMPQGFSFPAGVEFWISRSLSPKLPSRTAHNWQVIGRLKDGASLEQARLEATTVARLMKREQGDKSWMEDVAIVPLQEEMTARVRPALMILMGAVVFLLLIACANVVNLLLAQAAARQKEVSVRLALGATRGRMIRQFLTESLLLVFLGAGLGLLLAWWGIDTLLAFEPGNLPRTGDVGLDYRVMLFAGLISLLTASLLGFITAWRSTSQNLNETLKATSRSQLGGSTGRGTRNLLVIAQFAMTLILLTGAGLMARSLISLLSVDPGFRTEKSVVMYLSHTFPDNEAARVRLVNFHEQLRERLRAIPGVEDVGGVNSFPLSGAQNNGTFLIMQPNENITALSDFERLSRDPQRTGHADYRIADEGYFKTMGIPLLRGRLFNSTDGPDTQHVAVISESLAAKRWPGEDPLGKLIQFGNMDGNLKLFTIVGIVGDVREYGLDAEPRPTFYGYFKQRPFSSYSVVLHGSADETAVIPAARNALRQLDANLPPRFRTVNEVVSASIADRRFNLLLLGAFAGTALLLAVIGIYGVTSYSVTLRTQEIGVRMALGALPGNIFRMIMLEGLVLASLGVVIGLIGAFVLTRLIVSMLFGVPPHDPLTFALVASLLVAIALTACYFPARRATKVDPLIALRYE